MCPAAGRTRTGHPQVAVIRVMAAKANIASVYDSDEAAARKQQYFAAPAAGIVGFALARAPGRCVLGIRREHEVIVIVIRSRAAGARDAAVAEHPAYGAQRPADRERERRLERLRAGRVRCQRLDVAPVRSERTGSSNRP